MNATHNPGTWSDKALYPYQVELGTRGSTDYQWFGVTAFSQCTCGRINCEHVQAVRDMLLAEAKARDAAKRIVMVLDSDGERYDAQWAEAQGVIDTTDEFSQWARGW